MASEDSILDLIRAELAASEQRGAERLDRSIESLRSEFTGRLDRAVEALTSNMSELRAELNTRLENIERRTERTEINISSMLMQLAGINKSMTAAGQAESATLATLAAQQRAISELAARVAALERKAS